MQMIIADDEPKICRLLRYIVHWEELGLTFSGEYHEGISLLAAIRQCRPDIVLIDINMPGLSGIEIIERCRQEGIDCKFVIISGYSEFGYAQSALKMGVSDYLLKPIDEQAVNQTLKRIVTEIHVVQDKVRAMEKGINYSNFITHLLHEPSGFRQMSLPEVNERFYTDFREGAFRVIYIKIDAAVKVEEQLSITSVHRIVSDHINEMLETACHAIASTQYKMLDMVACLNYEISQSSRILHALEQLSDKLNTHLAAFSTSVTIGVSDEVSLVRDLPVCFSEALSSVRCRIDGRCGQLLLFHQQNIPDYNAQVYFPVSVRQMFQRHLLNRDKMQFNYTLKAFREQLQKEHPFIVFSAVSDLSSFCIQTLLSGQQDPDMGYQKNRMDAELHNCTNRDQLFTAVSANITELIDAMQSQEKAYMLRPIMKAQAYISENYSQALSLESVASQVGLSPAYFSSLFKKTTGENFIDYLVKVRIEKAKHLLESTYSSVREISAAVGYDDAHYFSKIFQRYVGIKPSEYRRLHS